MGLGCPVCDACQCLMHHTGEEIPPDGCYRYRCPKCGAWDQLDFPARGAMELDPELLKIYVANTPRYPE